MTDSLFQRVLIPVASRDDAETTMRATLPHLTSNDGEAILVHVIEKAGGAPDKASVEQREENAEMIFAKAGDVAYGSGVHIEREIAYGTDVAETIIRTAVEKDVSAIVFTPRGGSRVMKLLTGDVSHKLIEESDIPVITLPDSSTTDD